MTGDKTILTGIKVILSGVKLILTGVKTALTGNKIILSSAFGAPPPALAIEPARNRLPPPAAGRTMRGEGEDRSRPY